MLLFITENMLLGFVLLFLSKSTAQSTNTAKSFNDSIATIITSEAPSTAPSTAEKLPPLQVVATPDYPVAAGQSVHLLCSTPSKTDFFNWSWQHLQNHIWREVGSGRELFLTEPQHSGSYRCHAKNWLSQTGESPSHTVYIVSVQATVRERLGISAFVLSLLGLMSIISGLIWMCWQKLGGTVTVSSTAVKGVAGPEIASKGDLPQADSDGSVYINYTSTNHAYTDLDSTNITEENVYSSLS